MQGLPFEKEKYIVKGVKRLEDTQNADGSWGWWKNGQANIWMTTYVVKALHQAEQAGYKSQGLSKGMVYLRTMLPSVQGKDLLNILTLFSELAVPLAYETWVNKLDTTWNKQDLHTRLSLLKIKQAQSLPHSLEVLYDTQQLDVFGNSFWGQQKYHWYNTYTQNTLLAYEIFQQAGETKTCAKIERYLFCLLYTSPSPRDKRQSRMPSSA